VSGMKLPPRLWVPETARTGYDVPIPTATVNWPGRDWLIRRLSPGEWYTGWRLQGPCRSSRVKATMMDAPVVGPEGGWSGPGAQDPGAESGAGIDPEPSLTVPN
jgi:hypothetical protein